MTAIFATMPGGAEVRRVEMLYKRLLSGVVAALIGIFLCDAVLVESIGLERLKIWTAYMLSVLAVRIWIRYMFGKSDRQDAGIRKWEWAFAAGAFFTSIGWGALFGPLYPAPAHHDAQMFILFLSLIVAFSGAVFLAVSTISFWLFIMPILIPAFVQYANSLDRPAYWSVAAGLCCLVVIVLIQRTLYRSTSDNLRRNTEAESLLAEQQAIFESSPMGIAVIDNRQVVKCNPRLGELLGRRTIDLTTSSLQDHFVSTEEARQFLVDRTRAFDKGHLAQGVYRLRRADGSEFWAEFFGRKMPGGPASSVWMVADVTLRVANEQRSQEAAALQMQNAVRR